MNDLHAIVPAGMESGREDWKMSPAIAADGFLFLTGMTGRNDNGTVPLDPETQMVAAFDKVVDILREGGCGTGDIVEMTTYHRNLEAQLALFREVRGRYVKEPWPAWTAIGVSGFTHPDTIVEVRVIARLPKEEPNR